MGAERQVKLEQSGAGQTVHIPEDLTLPGDNAFIRKVGDEIVIRPADKSRPADKKMSNLLEWLQQQEPIDDEFPDVDEGLLPPRDVNL